MASSCHATETIRTSVDHTTVAIAGNPNSGKSTVFNLLTGLHQNVGNYPGVTVERRVGTLKGSEKVDVVDLPGTYSLSPRSVDERIAYDVITGRVQNEAVPDLLVCVANGTNLERNLYLASQLLETGIPVIVVLNMMDEVRSSGIEIDLDVLERELGCPVVPMTAKKGEGLDLLVSLIVGEEQIWRPSRFRLPDVLKTALEPLYLGLQELWPDAQRAALETECLRVLVNDNLLEHWLTDAPKFRESVLRVRASLKSENINAAQVEVEARYAYLREIARGALTRARSTDSYALSDKLDRILLHRVLGPILFAALLLLIFQSVFTWATPAMDLIESGMLGFGRLVRSSLPPGMGSDLLVDGIIAGVGNVLVFLPQILLLFFFLSLMESTGYMARSAFIMDKVMRKIGLSGGSVMPMMSAFACAVPAVMATRTMENPRDRLLTILVLPLMSCSARLPVYTLFIAAFIPAIPLFGPVGLQGATMFSLYILGTIAAFLAAAVLRRVLKVPGSPFVMELPPYRAPQWNLVFWRMWERARIFLSNAGKIIFLFSIIIWFAASFPKAPLPADLVARRAELENQISLSSEDLSVPTDELDTQRNDLAAVGRYESSYLLEHSFLGRLGHAIEPVMRPLGFDWKLSAGLIAAYTAREVIIGALATIYSVGDADENSLALRDQLREARDPDTGAVLYTPLVAISLLVFFVLALQCTSTLAIIRRELNSWKWPTFMWIYMTSLAYILSLIVFQTGKALGLG